MLEWCTHTTPAWGANSITAPLPVSGKPNCSRINHDNTRATSPMAIAVNAYWMAMTLASWEKTYFVIQLLA